MDRRTARDRTRRGLRGRRRVRLRPSSEATRVVPDDRLLPEARRCVHLGPQARPILAQSRGVDLVQVIAAEARRDGQVDHRALRPRDAAGLPLRGDDRGHQPVLFHEPRHRDDEGHARECRARLPQRRPVTLRLPRRPCGRRRRAGAQQARTWPTQRGRDRAGDLSVGGRGVARRQAHLPDPERARRSWAAESALEPIERRRRSQQSHVCRRHSLEQAELKDRHEKRRERLDSQHKHTRTAHRARPLSSSQDGGRPASVQLEEQPASIGDVPARPHDPLRPLWRHLRRPASEKEGEEEQRTLRSVPLPLQYLRDQGQECLPVTRHSLRLDRGRDYRSRPP